MGSKSIPTESSRSLAVTFFNAGNGGKVVTGDASSAPMTPPAPVGEDGPASVEDRPAPDPGDPPALGAPPVPTGTAASLPFPLGSRTVPPVELQAPSAAPAL